MQGAKDVTTLLSTTTALTLLGGTSSVDSLEFRSVIGGLQYLSLTCSDISFAVNKLSQFMHKPTTTHWKAAKRLLRYLKHTIFHGIHIQKSSSPNLTSYSDADWAVACIASSDLISGFDCALALNHSAQQIGIKATGCNDWDFFGEV
ncbi:uncharacterized mitochondrial protein AtMg00810-like [Malania oleifera]|uniref:uncharacterized mitochondrial protein AtMg00810-like n=1 Tax=Malania oleifera TaxID=397392 RepID=UPI0025ADF6E3|nr:uncharacterized mitochondrial protein AtMg00810-like [Malania oleifera]